ncbi:unnamed protein product [Rhizophagus irregularis]|nr:unnamed protein product [Rhizophagus irregularis]CAB4405860.1 unnamed protein product [Rhizophagus irregularis]
MIKKETIIIIIFSISLTWILTIFFTVQLPSQSKIQDNYIFNESYSNESYFCEFSKCKFLFPYKISEQESKAQKHMIQYAQMAQKLDRILILPNVGKSRIGSCLEYPFNYYYLIESLQRNFPNLKLMTQKQFYKWVKSQKNKKPSYQHIIIQENRNRKFHDFIKDQSNNNNNINIITKKGLCFDEIDEMDFDNNNNYNYNYNLTIGGRYWKNDQSLENLSNFIINNLKLFNNTEILLMEQKFIYPLFPNHIPHLEYSPHIINKAIKISQHIKPYIAIQWRMELGNPLNMPKCAEKLISRLEDLKKVYNTKNIYFATDYPLKDSLRQSFSFHDIKQEYHGKAIDILRDNINFFSWFNFTPTDQFGNNMNIKEFALSGIPGILDKIVCTRAKIFLIAPPECRKKTSSYTSMINSERFDLMKANVEGIENISLEW